MRLPTYFHLPVRNHLYIPNNKHTVFLDFALTSSIVLFYSLSRTLFFDDSLSALVTAKKLGMKVVGVYDKYYASDKTEIIKVADGYIESWENVWNLL